MKKKNQIFTVLLFLTTLCITAQPTIEWQKSLGGTGNDYGASIKQTYDGGYIVGGGSVSNDGNVTGNHGNGDFWIVKLTNIGSVDWQRSLGGSYSETLRDIKQTSDSGYIVVGSSESSDGDITSNYGGSDYWVVKLTSNGSIDWEKNYGGTDDDFAYSIEETVDGGYIIAGHSISTDGDVIGNHGMKDYWVVKVDSIGTIDWQKSLGGSGSDWGYSVKQTNDGGYIVAGFSNSNDNDVTGNHGNSDCWIVKLSVIGDISWQKSYGGTGGEVLEMIQQTSDGGYILAASSTSNDGDVGSNYGLYDYWIIKVSSDGTIIWKKPMGGTYFDWVHSIQETTDGGFIVSGRSSSSDIDVTGHHFSYDYWIVKLSTTGNISWQKSLGGDGADIAYSIQQTIDGGYIVAGASESTNGDVVGNQGFHDYWVVKLSAVIGINEVAEQNLFSVFPNPATNQINVKVDANLIGAVYTVYDNMGKKVLSGKLNTENTVIELGNLSGGMYLFSVGENMQQTFKVVKE